MRLSPTLFHRRRAGFALLITMVFLAIMLAAYASLMYWTTTNSKITKRNNLFNQAQAAAESATESVLATMMRDFNNQALNSASTYAAAGNLPSQSGWPVSYLFSDTNGNANSTTVIPIGSIGWSALPARYNGLFGSGQDWVIASTASPTNAGENLSATINQTVWFGFIPIFQFAIFYNMDLEINPGDTFNVNGKVHSNNNIYATGNGSGTPLTFSDLVEYAGSYSSTRSPLDPSTRSGNVIFTMSSNNPAKGSSLSLPVGTNNNPATVISILGIPPAGLDPISPSGQSFIFNQSDIVITNSSTGVISVYYQNFNLTPSQILIPKDATNVVSGVTNISYSFATNTTFYDYREAKTVKSVDLDVNKFSIWLTNATGGATRNSQNLTGITAKGHPINGVYVYNNGAGSGQLPAVRVVNGQQLPPGGLSVATPFPLYVKGNYNTTTNGSKFSLTLGDTTNTYPAALMGDALTGLSQNYVDTATSSGSTRTPISTTVNAACLEGIVPSDGTHYSGGVENFLRLLENWSGNTLTYNGSIVVLFQSQYATSFWGNSSYYSPPTRKWGFDLNFKQQSKLPPMTPQVRATIRKVWATK